jgi:IS30 family transposase
MLALDEMERLWELRMAGYSLQDIARMTGYTPSTVAKAIKAFDQDARQYRRWSVLALARMRAWERAQERDGEEWEEER